MGTDAGRMWIIAGAILAGLAVVSGAFGAHTLADKFAEQYAGQTRKVAGEEIPAARKYLQDFGTGATYQMYHAFAILAVGILLQRQPNGWLTVAAWLFLVGVILFSGSLYVLTLSGVRVWGAVTPFGGIALILGWLAVAAGLWTSTPSAPRSPETPVKPVHDAA